MVKTFKNFEEDDLFGRKHYAEFLKHLILHSDEYHREDDMDAYTIAIDSPWGTGKSVFLEKFQALLQKEPQEKIRAIYYNAWEQDFWDNAFEPIAEAIFSNDLFNVQKEDGSTEEICNKLLLAIKALAKGFAKKIAEKVIDSDELENTLDHLKSAYVESNNPDNQMTTKEFQEFTQGLKNLKMFFSDYLENNLPDGKLVVIIDELDRCKPTDT